MATPHLRRCFERMALVSSLLISIAACSDSGTAADKPDGGQGGSTGVAGGGGSSLVGGHTASGGAGGDSTGSAGNTGLAGSSGSGGKLGGATATGGTSVTAGTTATGGKSTTGGATAGGATTGGATTGGKTAGGTTGSGGNTTTGGSTGSAGKTGTGGTTTGGNTSAGGTTGTGGKSATGGATGGSSGAGGTSGSGEYGFSYRPVGDKQLDYLCTLKAAGASTYVYVQMNQTGEKSVGIATIPVYTPVLSKISVNGAVSDLANTQYDYGGGHHNDSLQFDYQGGTYKYYHSSFGFGSRSCQPMDCVTSPTTDGCTSARALPEVCVEIKADGTHDPLKDTFKKCAGDSNP